MEEIARVCLGKAWDSPWEVRYSKGRVCKSTWRCKGKVRKVGTMGFTRGTAQVSKRSWRCDASQGGWVRMSKWPWCKCRGAGGGWSDRWDLPQRRATFPAGFPIDFLENLAGKVANGEHVIMGQLATGYKYKWITKHPGCNHMTAVILGWPDSKNWF